MQLAAQGRRVLVHLRRADPAQPEGAQGAAVLGEGEVGHALTIRAHAFSASAKAKIEAAGGTAQVIERAPAGSDD